MQIPDWLLKLTACGFGFGTAYGYVLIHDSEKFGIAYAHVPTDELELKDFESLPKFVFTTGFGCGLEEYGDDLGQGYGDGDIISDFCESIELKGLELILLLL